MKKKQYDVRHKRRASTLMALGSSECDASSRLLDDGLFREAVVHLYFSCFYVSQALLCDALHANPSHKALNNCLHKVYGRHREFPRRYIDLHTELFNQRVKFDYRTAHSPDPDELRSQFRKLQAYVNFAMSVVPRVGVMDILGGIAEECGQEVRDFSFDIYCPRTYSHHTRITLWQPPFYLSIFNVNMIAKHMKHALRQLRVKNHHNYVVGINSKIDQYRDNHLLMIDIDAVNPAVEAALKPIGGILLKSGRGFHFIGRSVISGSQAWRREMQGLLRHKRLKRHVDRNHVLISLRRGYSTLRVTSSPVKPTVPFFYKEI